MTPDLTPYPAPFPPRWLFRASAVFCACWALSALLHAAIRIAERIVQ